METHHPHESRAAWLKLLVAVPEGVWEGKSWHAFVGLEVPQQGIDAMVITLYKGHRHFVPLILQNVCSFEGKFDMKVTTVKPL